MLINVESYLQLTHDKNLIEKISNFVCITTTLQPKWLFYYRVLSVIRYPKTKCNQFQVLLVTWITFFFPAYITAQIHYTVEVLLAQNDNIPSSAKANF